MQLVFNTNPLIDHKLIVSRFSAISQIEFQENSIT